MSKSLYVTAVERQSGKLLIVLGLMDMLTRRMGQVAYFRPVVRSAPDYHDSHVQLLAERYNLEYDYSEMYGVTSEEARGLLLDGKHEQLLKKIFTKYKALEERSEFVLCEGTDFSSFAQSLEFDFNSRVANNIAGPVLVVVNGKDKNVVEISDNVELACETFEREGCSIAAAIVNRAEPQLIGDLFKQLAPGAVIKEPVYVLPENDNLTRLTLADVAEGLQARQIGGKSVDLMREIRDTKIAAMQLPHFLEHVSEGCLVITPGDRGDVITASQLAVASDNYPSVAGILLTGGLEPAISVQRLIEGISSFVLPVLSVSTDTYTTTTKLNELKAQIVPENIRKIATALNLFESFVDTEELAERITIARSEVRTPIMFEYEIIQRAKKNRQRIVLPEGTDERILRAVEILKRRDVVDITLLGTAQEVIRRADTLGVDLGDTPIVDPLESDNRDKYAKAYFQLRKHKGISEEQAFDIVSDVSYFGTMMVYCDDADGMVSGAAHTTQHTIRPSFETIKTRPGVSIVSSVFLMCLADRVVVFGDCAVNPDPNPKQLADIALSSAETAITFGIEPRIALLSYSTGESGKGAEVEKVREAARIALELRPELQLEGPMQFDAAFDPAVAAKKAPKSTVAGKANVFVFPDLNTGNNTYKAVQRTSGAVAIGPVLQGLKKPVNDLSRGCTVTDVVNTVAITAVQAQLKVAK